MKQRYLFDMTPYERPPARPARRLYAGRRRLPPDVEAALLRLKLTIDAEADRHMRAIGGHTAVRRRRS